MSNIKLKNIFICENVVVSFNGQPSLINLISEITSNAFPAIHPKLSILVSITGDNGTTDSEKVEIISVDDKKVIAQVNGKAEIRGAGLSNFVGNFINTVFPKEGKYWIKVMVGADIITNENEHYIMVKKSF